MSTPLVSVVMPLFNAVRYLDEAIASVVAQTMPDWELILVDDCSRDGSAERALQFAKSDRRITVLRHTRNLGAAVARNSATEAARARWLAFLDADDVWLPEKLERQLEFAERGGFAFVHHWYSRMEADGTPRPGVVAAPERLTYTDLLRANRIGCLTAMYDTGRAGKVYAPDIAARNDYAVWLAVLKRVGEARCLPEALALYRLSPGSLSRRKLGLVTHHYRLFREIEGLSPQASAFYVSCNVLSRLARR